MKASPTVHASRISHLRFAMAENGIDAAIVPLSDPHLSEYLPARWRGIEWLSGFTGSAGTLIVTVEFAGLWTDSRYWSQAENELSGSGIALMQASAGAVPSYVTWLTHNLASAQVVWADGMVLSLQLARQLKKALLDSGMVLHTEGDLLDAVWPDRPALPAEPVYEHGAIYTAATRSQKLAELRSSMQLQGAQWHFISTLDDISWLLNLRGADVPFNPLFLGHVMVGLKQATLFIREDKVPTRLRQELEADGVRLATYDKAVQSLSDLKSGEVLLIDPRRISFGAWQAVPAKVNIIEAVNPTTLVKSRKDEGELAHVRLVMEQDGAALCEFFAWLEQSLTKGRAVTELDVGDKLLSARERKPGFVSPSFDTIAGFNANGALPHYRAVPGNHAVIAGDGLLLVDSGGQYLGGTTDITRTVPIGQPSAGQKRDFTLVLKGLIALSRAHYPRGIRGPMLDGIARAPLWAEGMDYGHGTGHGVGYFLNVHEGPQSISYRAAAEAHTAMEEGMITSIEPAVYRPGGWGVRIENLVACRPAVENEFGDFLRFETLTLCPIDARCIEPMLLRTDEIAWLNAYHAEVRQRLLPLVHGDARDWLLTRTEAL